VSATGAPPHAAAPVEPARGSANTELTLLVLSVLIIGLAYALIGLSQEPVLPSGLAGYGGAMAALAAIAHIVRRRYAPHADPLLLPLAFLLNGVGLVMVRRIDFALEARGSAQAALAPQQTVWTLLAIGAFCATLVLIRDHRILDRYRYVIGIAAIVALLLPLLPVIGVEINGARIWLRLGPASIQPGEFAKLGLAVFFASYLAEKRQLLSVATSRLGPFMVPPARAFGPVILMWLASLSVLVFQKDLGLSLLLFGMFAVLLYVATARFAYVAIAGLLFSAGAYAAYHLFGHVRVRVAIWLDPFADPTGTGFQLVQSLFALGTGGIAGVGWGNGRPDFIPFVQTDFIFSAFGEELGLLGVTAILLCYFLIVGRGFAVAIRSRDDFGTLLASCLTIIFGLQVFVIVGGVTRLIPLSGITLPFASYGGSSLLSNYILIALLLRVSSTSAEASATAPAPRSADEGTPPR
jgi:cell division protein FtsW (lipid II flippase)